MSNGNAHLTLRCTEKRDGLWNGQMEITFPKWVPLLQSPSCASEFIFSFFEKRLVVGGRGMNGSTITGTSQTSIRCLRLSELQLKRCQNTFWELPKRTEKGQKEGVLLLLKFCIVLKGNTVHPSSRLERDGIAQKFFSFSPIKNLDT